MKFIFFALVMPAMELWLLIKIGDQIGAFNTIVLLFLSVIVGINLLKQQGFSTLLKMNQKMASGENPATEAVEGILLALAGALFIFPGFITDAMAVLLVIPFSRRLLAQRWAQQFDGAATVHFHTQGGAYNDQDNVIEGEFKEVKPEDKRLN